MAQCSALVPFLVTRRMNRRDLASIPSSYAFLFPSQCSLPQLPSDPCFPGSQPRALNLSLASNTHSLSNLQSFLLISVKAVFYFCRSGSLHISATLICSPLMLLPILFREELPCSSTPTVTSLQSEKETEKSTKLLKRNVLNSHHFSTWL